MLSDNISKQEVAVARSGQSAIGTYSCSFLGFGILCGRVEKNLAARVCTTHDFLKSYFLSNAFA